MAAYFWPVVVMVSSMVATLFMVVLLHEAAALSTVDAAAEARYSQTMSLTHQTVYIQAVAMPQQDVEGAFSEEMAYPYHFYTLDTDAEDTRIRKSVMSWIFVQQSNSPMFPSTGRWQLRVFDVHPAAVPEAAYRVVRLDITAGAPSMVTVYRGRRHG